MENYDYDSIILNITGGWNHISTAGLQIHNVIGKQTRKDSDDELSHYRLFAHQGYVGVKKNVLEIAETWLGIKNDYALDQWLANLPLRRICPLGNIQQYLGVAYCGSVAQASDGVLEFNQTRIYLVVLGDLRKQ